MARICPSCNKFAPIEQGEPELELDLEEGDEPGTGRITGSVRLVLNSGCCGDELAEANLDVPDDATFDHPHGDSEDDKHEVEIAGEDAENSDRYDGRKGAPARYQRHYYGADVTVSLKCKCGWEGEVKFSVEEQASGFDDLV